jgi:hypothetical protein
VERDKPKLESVGQTLLQLPWKQKRGDKKKNWIPFIKLHETWWSYRYMFLVGPKVFSFVVKGG